MPDLPEELQEFRDNGLITDVIGKIKEGKEGAVFLCRAHPDTGEEYLAAKVHRAQSRRAFQNDGVYREGRRIGSRTVRRAMEMRSGFGRKMLARTWLADERRALIAMTAAGVRVPRVHGASDFGILMQFVGDGGEAAPQLRSLRPEPQEALRLWHDVSVSIERALDAHTVHADLSPYNILVHHGEAWLIDWPQSVDARKNPHAQELLRRDVDHVLSFLGRFGVGQGAHAFADRLWARYVRGELG